MANNNSYLESVIAIAKETSNAILDIYRNSSQFDVTTKADASPLTQADLLAHDLIVKKLQQLTPEIPVISEEGADISFAERQQWQRFWLVDPIDGTREFIQHSGEFTINIALVENHRAILGVIYIPVLETVYYAVSNCGAYKKEKNLDPVKIQVNKINNKKINVAVGNYYKIAKLQQVLSNFDDIEILTVGSAQKFCWVAEGRADFYPRMGITYEWDTAAGQIIVEEAGGVVLDFDFKPLRYNSRETLLNPNFMALGDSEKIIALLKK